VIFYLLIILYITKAVLDCKIIIIITKQWNQALHTDREIRVNRPDIIIKNNKEKTFTLIDVAIPANRNVVQKDA